MKLLHHTHFLLFFKVVVFILMTWFIIHQLFFQNNIQQQWNVFRSNFHATNSGWFFAAVLLMPVNWLLETIKWKWLIRSKATFTNLLKSIIAGITLGFITPARSGEFIGRVMFLDEEEKTKVFYLSVVGGIAHTAITLSAGALCFSLWSGDALVTGAITGAAVLFLLFYFRFDILNRFVSSIPFLERRNLILHHHHLPRFAVQVKVLLITALRYLVYILQYALLLMYFGVSADFLGLLVHNGVFFLIHSFSPLMPFLDFSFRGGVALYVYQEFSANNIAVLTAVTWAWMLNLVVPAIIGYLFILKRRTIAHVV